MSPTGAARPSHRWQHSSYDPPPKHPIPPAHRGAARTNTGVGSWNPRPAAPSAPHRRAWAGFQMGFLVVVLWPLFGPPVTLLAGFAFMFPPLIGFLIDWLIVSGSIDRQSESADRFFQKLTKFGQTFAQPALRLAVVVMMAATLGRSEWLSDLWSGGVVVIGLLILLGGCQR